MIKIAKYLLLILLVATSCKSKKAVIKTNDMTSLTSKKIIKNHTINAFNQKTLSAKLKTNYTDNKTDVNLTIKLRLEKDKTIWMSATKFSFPVAKIIITPKGVKFYEKIKNTYFEGDFSYLSQLLGAELDFKKFQNLLLGQAILDLKEQKYEASLNGGSHQLKPKKNNINFDILFWINPTSFKLDKQEINHLEKQQKFSVFYNAYQELNNQIIPKKIEMIAVDEKKATNIKLDFTSVEINKKLTFPFKIPNGYKKIQLKN